MNLIAGLLLAAGLAQGHAQPSAALRSALLESMDHWALVARADDLDPRIKGFSEELTGLRLRAASDLDGCDAQELQADFDSWKDRLAELRLAKLGGASRPLAEGEADAYRRRLEQGAHELALLPPGLDAKRLESRLSTLKQVLSGHDFKYLVDGSADLKGADGELPFQQALRGTGRPAGGPQGSGRPGFRSDLRTAGPAGPMAAPPVDQSLARRFLDYVNAHPGGTVGKCYRGFKRLAESVHLVDHFSGPVNQLASAYQFPAWEAAHHPGNFHKVAEPSLKLLQPTNAVVWGRGVCGYNDEHGHIEWIVSVNRDKDGKAVHATARSDHFSRFNLSCFETAARQVTEARGRLKTLAGQRLEAEKALAAAHEGSDAQGARAAQRRLAEIKAAAAEQGRIARKVTVYWVEPGKA